MKKQELEAFADFRDGDRVWIHILRTEEDGKQTLIRRNAGIDSLILMGLASLSVTEIAEQMRGVIHPDVIKREILDEGAKGENS